MHGAGAAGGVDRLRHRGQRGGVAQGAGKARDGHHRLRLRPRGLRLERPRPVAAHGRTGGGGNAGPDRGGRVARAVRARRALLWRLRHAALRGPAPDRRGGHRVARCLPPGRGGTRERRRSPGARHQPDRARRHPRRRTRRRAGRGRVPEHAAQGDLHADGRTRELQDERRTGARRGRAPRGPAYRRVARPRGRAVGERRGALARAPAATGRAFSAR